MNEFDIKEIVKDVEIGKYRFSTQSLNVILGECKSSIYSAEKRALRELIDLEELRVTEKILREEIERREKNEKEK